MQIVYLARHATPDWTLKDIPYHLPPGPPLIDLGKQEALALAVFLRQEGVRKMYTSPLERCQHTAQIVNQLTMAELEVREGIKEWQPGETGDEVVARCLPVFEEAVKDCQMRKPAALITHGGPIAALLVHLGMSRELLEKLRKFDRKNALPPAGAWKVWRENEREKWKLELAFTPNHGELIK